jgi:hypothetical protein
MTLHFLFCHTKPKFQKRNPKFLIWLSDWALASIILQAVYRFSTSLRRTLQLKKHTSAVTFVLRNLEFVFLKFLLPPPIAFEISALYLFLPASNHQTK